MDGWCASVERPSVECTGGGATRSKVCHSRGARGATGPWYARGLRSDRPRGHPWRAATRPARGGERGSVQAVDAKRRLHIKEPKDNVYGRFKVLQRTDGLFLVHDTEEWPPNGPVFRSEDEARDHAKVRSSAAGKR